MKKSNILQLLIVIIGIDSITINLILFKDWKGIFYYTIISNTYVTLLYGVSLCLSLRNKLVKNNTYYMMKGLMLLSIMCTMFIFFFVVGSKDGVYSGHPVECLTVHLLMPVLAMLECLLFENKKVLK